MTARAALAERIDRGHRGNGQRTAHAVGDGDDDVVGGDDQVRRRLTALINTKIVLNMLDTLSTIAKTTTTGATGAK